MRFGLGAKRVGPGEQYVSPEPSFEEDRPREKPQQHHGAWYTPTPLYYILFVPFLETFRQVFYNETGVRTRYAKAPGTPPLQQPLNPGSNRASKDQAGGAHRTASTSRVLTPQGGRQEGTKQPLIYRVLSILLASEPRPRHPRISRRNTPCAWLQQRCLPLAGCSHTGVGLNKKEENGAASRWAIALP